MDFDKNKFTFETICETIRQFSPCMDDYLYVFDLEQDKYYISENATERFDVKTNLFTNVLEELTKFVYPDDVDVLVQDLEALTRGEKDEHNIRYRWIGKDGQPIWINCRGRMIKDSDQKSIFMVGCVNEIGTKPIADNISGLLTSSAIEKVLTGYCENWKNGYVLRLGIDDFKDINEKFGTEYGDFVLRGVADCIEASLLPGQKVYSMLSDEFIVVDFVYGTQEDAKELYRRIRQELDLFVEKNNYEAVYTISGGVITCQDVKEPDYSEIMKLSQFALSEAKNRGKNQVYIFREEDYQKFLRKRKVLRALRESVAADFAGFELYFQPIVSAENGRLYASEALLRFMLPDGERVSPVEFIPVLEESGLIIPVGKWVLEKAIDMCKTCQESYPGFRVSINLSYVQILKSPITDEIYQHIEDSGIAPQSLIVEMTESGYLENTPSVKRVWNHLKQFGVSIAIDDFGTGYSNLQSIGNMTPHIVKIDRGFTIKALQNQYENQVMTHVIEMVHSLGLTTCVEGIETQEELDQIRKLSPDYIQGYYFGKPCNKATFLEEFVRKTA